MTIWLIGFNIVTFLVIVLAVFMISRVAWVYRVRLKWINWVHEYNMREIERVACEDPFALKYLDMNSSARYAALLPHEKCCLKIFTWKLDGLVADRERYEEVMRFYEQTKETLQ